MLLKSDWMKRASHITNAMIYDEATRISGIDWLTDKNYSSRKYVEAKLQAAHIYLAVLLLTLLTSYYI